ncbi:MAG: AI-2E family transporter [Halobacteriaceae archaeon]
MASHTQRRYVLGGVLGLLLLVAAASLFDVLGTVFFAVTVAYLLAPLHEFVADHGVPGQVASGVVTAVALVGGVVPAGVAALLTYRHRDGLLGLLTDLPETVVVGGGGLRYVVDVASVQDAAVGYARGVAVDAARSLPVLALKFSLFVVLVYALLVARGQVASALLAPVPREYHDVAQRLHERVRSTLVALYVLQGLTAVGTFAFAVPVFVGLGYPYAVTLAFVAGVLQFLPIVGPSVLVVALAAYQVSVGAVVQAALVLVVGGLVVAVLPDVLIRPRFASARAKLPGGLYFVGFVGGLLTLGPVGIIAGPLVVALVVEATLLLAEENVAPPAALD